MFKVGEKARLTEKGAAYMRNECAKPQAKKGDAGVVTYASATMTEVVFDDETLRNHGYDINNSWLFENDEIEPAPSSDSDAHA